VLWVDCDLSGGLFTGRGVASVPLQVSSHSALVPSQVQPLNVIRPAIEPRYITPAPPGVEVNVFTPAPPLAIAAAALAPPPSLHLPPPGIPLGPPLLPRQPVQPAAPQVPPLLPPGVAYPAAGRAAVIAAAPPPTYPLPGTVTVIGFSVSFSLAVTVVQGVHKPGILRDFSEFDNFLAFCWPFFVQISFIIVNFVFSSKIPNFASSFVFHPKRISCIPTNN